MIESSAIFAFLNHPAMLGWLAAAAAPWILHLWNRRKHREVPWAAIEFLLAALRKNSRRLLIEQWILLAVRTLVIVLLVLAVAEPFLEHAGLKFVSGQRAHKLLVIDGSFSMAYKPTDKSRFDRAKELAARIVAESSQGDGYTLLVMSDPPRVVVGTPAFEPRDFLEEIENLRLPHGGADLPATLAKVEEILQAARRDHARLVRQEVIFLTDLGRATWFPDLRGAEAAAEFRQRSERLAGQAQLMVIDLGQAGGENIALTSLRPTEPFATAAHDVTLEAEVRNFGRQTRTGQLVELLVDGRRAGEEHVDLEPGTSASVDFVYRFDTAGDHLVEVRLATDLLDVDNHRWLSLPVRGQLRALCVNGRPAGGPFEGATDYLVVALAPHGPTDDRGLVRPEVVPESALVELDLDQFDCIFLADVGQFTASEARLLGSYLANGGGLVFFLGDQVQPASYNRQLASGSSDRARVLPARLGQKVVDAEPYLALDPLGYQHPLVSAFQGQESAGLLTARVNGYFKLLLADPTSAKVALALDNGDPLVVEEAIGRGRSILVATSADISWTTMPAGASYLPIVHELVALAVRGQVDERNSTVGQALGGSLRTLATGTAVQVHTPAGDTGVVRLTSEGDFSRWSYEDTSQSGVYRARFGAPVSHEEAFAVNVDTAESDLAKLDPVDLKTEVWPGVPFKVLDDWQNLSEEPAQEIVRRNALHHWLLVGVLALLFLETSLACAFGRRVA